MVSILINKVINSDLHIVVDHLRKKIKTPYIPLLLFLGVAIALILSICYESLKLQVNH